MKRHHDVRAPPGFSTKKAWKRTPLDGRVGFFTCLLKRALRRILTRHDRQLSRKSASLADQIIMHNRNKIVGVHKH